MDKTTEQDARNAPGRHGGTNLAHVEQAGTAPIPSTVSLIQEEERYAVDAKWLILLLIGQALHLAPAISHARTPTGPVYYISPTGNDANAGSATTPWRTIQKAANSVSAGATVILMDGTYEEGSINFKRSGTADNRITFKAQNKWKAVLSSTSGCNPGLAVYASYITVKDIHFTLSPRNVTCATYSSANVAIRAWGSMDPTPANPSTGYVGFVADGIKVDAGLERAVALKSNQDFSVIENSEFGNLVELMNSKNSVVRKNLVFGQDKWGFSIVAKGGVRNAQIYDNVIRNKFPNGYGIVLGGYSCDACHFDTTTNIEAYNSVAYNNVVIDESGTPIAALVLQGAKDSAFFNNVVVNGQLAMTYGGHNTGPQAVSSNPTFKNNIVICNGQPVQSARGWSGNYTGTLNVDYNNFYNCKDAPPQLNPVAGEPAFCRAVNGMAIRERRTGVSTSPNDDRAGSIHRTRDVLKLLEKSTSSPGERGCSA